jgi:tetratricopeptide (TPR) repeat protein
VTITDRWGTGIETVSEDAARLLEQATTEFMLFRDDPAATLDTAIEADPDAPLPRIVRAELDLFGQTRHSLQSARDRLAEVDLLLDNASQREQLHAAAADAWASGQLDIAARLLDRAVAIDPHDLLALRLSHDLSFFLGDSKNIRDVVARARYAWRESDPLFGAVQGMYAFGLEETAEYRRAEESAQAALRADQSDVWAIHALAHVLEMEGRTDEGIDFLSGSSVRWEDSFFAVHNWWHLALYFIEEDRLYSALSVYDDAIRKSDSGEWLDLVDAAALLWRLWLLGVDVKRRAEVLVDLLEPRTDDALYVFNDLHAIMAFSLAEREDLVRAVIDANRREDGTTNSLVHALSGAELFQGFGQLAQGDAAGAGERLLRARSRSSAIGGSVAQRDIIDQTLIASAARSGDQGLVRALTSERVERKSSTADSVGRLVAANTR